MTIEYDADLSKSEPDLFKLAKNNDVEGVRRLLTSYDFKLHMLNMVPDNGMSVTFEGISPLMVTTSVEIAKLLLDAGLSIELRQRFPNGKFVMGSTALMYAADRGDIEMVKFLVERGADIYNTNFLGQSASSFARKSGHKNVENLLLKAAKKKYDSASQRCIKIELELLREEIGKAILEGNRYDLEYSVGNPIFKAEGSTWEGQCLTSAIDPTHEDNQRIIEILKILIGGGIDVNVRDKFGRTALMVAKENRKEDVIKFLKEEGAT
jgi:ankyrin repeat protein